MVRFFGPTLYKVVGNLHRIEAETKQQIKATWQLTNSVLAYVSRESERVPCDRIAPPPLKNLRWETFYRENVSRLLVKAYWRKCNWSTEQILITQQHHRSPDLYPALANRHWWLLPRLGTGSRRHSADNVLLKRRNYKHFLIAAICLSNGQLTSRPCR